MDKKGFTLIELLAVIVILGVIITLSTMGVTSVIKSSKTKVGEFTIKQIEEAAKTYAIDNKYSGNINIRGNDIITQLKPYFNEIADKCQIDNNSSINIIDKNYDYQVDIVNIECEK